MRPTFLSAIFWCCLSGNARGEIEQQALQHPTHALLPILSPFLCVILTPPHPPLTPPVPVSLFRSHSLSPSLSLSLSLSLGLFHILRWRGAVPTSLPCLLCCKVSDSRCNDPTGCSNCSASVLPRCTRPAFVLRAASQSSAHRHETATPVRCMGTVCLSSRPRGCSKLVRVLSGGFSLQVNSGYNNSVCVTLGGYCCHLTQHNSGRSKLVSRASVSIA